MDASTVIAAGAACAQCKFWHRQDEHLESGQCRRNPPVPVGLYENAFPFTQSTTWCGEFEKTEIARAPIVPVKPEIKPLAPKAPAPAPSDRSKPPTMPVLHIDKLRKFQEKRAAQTVSA